MGVLLGWWFGGVDLWFFELYMDSVCWDIELCVVGFVGVEVVVYDGYFNNNIIIMFVVLQLLFLK